MKAALILAMTASPALACMPMEEMDAALKRFGEVPIMIGHADNNTLGIIRHVIYIGSRTYTVVEIFSDGTACVAATGHSAEVLQLPGQGT